MPLIQHAGWKLSAVALACLVGSFLLCRALVASPFGAVLRGIRENEARAISHRIEKLLANGLYHTMDWEELKETTMDPGPRTLLRVTVEQAALADEITSVLMGDDVESRKNFITTNARDVRNLDF